MIHCTRRLQFCAGHRVHNHESKCSNLHGHNYVAFFQATMIPSGIEEYAPPTLFQGRPKDESDPAQLDELGRVIDFSVLKSRIGTWIDNYWDHGMILWKEDHTARSVVGGMANQKLFLLPVNPTAENMADYLLRVVCPQVLDGLDIVVTKVTLWETENCHAEASL